MHNFKQIFAYLLLLATFAPAAQAKDTFYRLGINELNIREDTTAPRDRSTKWGYIDNPMQPYAHLDGAGEAYIDFRADWPRRWRDLQSFRTTLLVRAEEGQAIKGILYLPRRDWSGMNAFRFEIVPQQANTDARKDFYDCKAAHYQRLLDAGIPGGSWFAHEIQSAAKELGNQIRTKPGSVARSNDLSGTFALFSGTRAVAENLALTRQLPVDGQEQKQTVKVSSIRGITVKAIDWAPYIKDANPALDPLAELIPQDQHALLFPSFDSAMALMDEGDALAGALLPIGEQRGEDAQVLKRYQKQLCLSATGLARLVGPKVIGSIAITGSDLYLRVGSDVAVLFETKDAASLKNLLTAQITLAARSATDLKTSAGAIQGIEYRGWLTPDRRICSYMMELGPAIIISNSLAQLERLVDLRKANGADTLRTLPEYTWFRARYPRNAADETALLVISDATIRRWCGARWRIGDSRRTRAGAVMAAAATDHLDKQLAGKSGALESPWADSGKLSLQNGLLHSDTYGASSFMTPIIELDLDHATEDEAGAYQIWRDGYERGWRTFDPIALKLSAQKQQFAFDLTIMPLALSSEYLGYVELSRGIKIAATDGDPHGAAMRFTLAINKNSPNLKPAAEMFQRFAGPPQFDPLGWLGSSISIYLDDDAFWEKLAKAGVADDFKIEDIRGLPMGIHIESTDAAKLNAFVDAVHRVVKVFFHDSVAFETVPHKVQPYGKISLSEKGKKDWRVPDGFAVYYAALPDALLISFNEDLIHRALARLQSRAPAKGEGKKPQPSNKPYLGESFAMQVDGAFAQKAGMNLWPEFPYAMQAIAWGNIPILNEWKRLYPREDPAALHERLLGVKLVSPDGSGYVWNAEFNTMESVSYGSPAQPKSGPAVPAPLNSFKFINAGIDFEKEGLRARVVLQKSAK
jgi:hypothetical protein